LLIEYLRYGLPQIGTGIGVVLLSATSRYFIQYYQGSDAVGVFSAAFKFGELSILLPLGIFTSIFAPYVYRELELNGKQSAYASILKYSTLYLFFFGPIFILLFLFPKLPMILLGNNFESSLSIIPIICLANFFFGYAQFLAFYSQIDFKPMLVTIAILATTVLSILLNILLIPAFGIFGSAYSIILAYLFYIGLIVYLSKISVKLISLGSFFALAITTIVYYKISAHVSTIESLLWVKILIGCSIWGVLALIMYLFGQFKSYKLA
jgi:O-antigen/teichoic acid export membrane protein